MLSPTDFYEAYLYDYHKIKIKQLYYSLNNIDNYISSIYSDKDPHIINDDRIKERIELQLRIDIRMTMFHSIETLFELIFALSPINGVDANELDLIHMLSNSNFRRNYEEIKKISLDQNYLNKFNDIISINGFQTTILEYLFYRILINSTLLEDDKFKSEYNESLIAIKNGLFIIAKEFNDRDDYNAFKHSLRVINTIKSIYLAKANNINDNIKFDYSNSITYLKDVSKKENKDCTIVVKPFDTIRDYNITDFCSKLIYQIIRYRQTALNLGKFNKDSQFPILLYTIDSINKGLNHNINSLGLEIKQRKYHKE